MTVLQDGGNCKLNIQFFRIIYRREIIVFSQFFILAHSPVMHKSASSNNKFGQFQIDNQGEELRDPYYLLTHSLLSYPARKKKNTSKKKKSFQKRTVLKKECS